MNSLILRYTVALLCGGVLGHVFPVLVSGWLVVFLLVFWGINELVGLWGFGRDWPEYRLSLYFVHTGVAVCVVIGILFGSGSIGKFLVLLGKAINH